MSIRDVRDAARAHLYGNVLDGEEDEADEEHRDEEHGQLRQLHHAHTVRHTVRRVAGSTVARGHICRGQVCGQRASPGMATGLSSHQVPELKSAKVRERAKGRRVIQIQRKRTLERV